MSKAVSRLKSPPVIGGIGTLVLTIAMFFAQGGFANMNPLYVLGFVVGIGLIVYGLIMAENKEKALAIEAQDLGNVVTRESLAKTLEAMKRRGRLGDMSPLEKDWILAKSLEMTWVHGHEDFLQLLAEMADGIPFSELMTRPCSRCGVPRNQKGNSLP